LTPHWLQLFGQSEVDNGVLGRVVRQDRGFVIVATEGGLETIRLHGRRMGPVVVGDWVVVAGETVAGVLDRVSLLSRQSTESETQQALVANVDLVFIVCGADRPLSSRRIERALTQVFEANAAPVVVINKFDLLNPAGSELADLQNDLPGMDVVTVSSRTDHGLPELRLRMADKTSVMTGESGAGKSTMVNALLQDEVALTSAVRKGDSKGRHTTTRRELHVLSTGGVLIDTPGIRSLGLWADESSVDAAFSDVAAIADQCRFTDCAHETEPGCAVVAAIASGELDPARAEAWTALTREVASLERRSSEHDKRQHERTSSRVVDDALKRKGRR